MGIELGAVRPNGTGLPRVRPRGRNGGRTGRGAAGPGCLTCSRGSTAVGTLLPGPLGGRVVALVHGVLLGGFGWDLEDLGDGLSQAYHHLVRVAAKVAGLDVPQGLVPRVVAS